MLHRKGRLRCPAVSTDMTTRRRGAKNLQNLFRWHLTRPEDWPLRGDPDVRTELLAVAESLRVNGDHCASRASDTGEAPRLSSYLRTCPTLGDSPEYRVELPVLTLVPKVSSDPEARQASRATCPMAGCLGAYSS